MLQNFKHHLNTVFPNLKGKTILLATSGGLDSMVMCFLFKQLNYKIAVAHCNFQLRNEESNVDETFVETWAKVNQVAFFSTQFETNNYAETQKLSIQIAARELRYQWFKEIAETQNIPFIATAHHADDNVETFLINLSRGTGLDGLIGIPQQKNNIIRPLLPFSRTEIENFAKENKIVWREDSSNASDKYLRNKIRHQMVPSLKSLNNHFLNNFNNTQHNLQQANSLITDAAQFMFEQVAETCKDTICFDVLKMKAIPNINAYLFQWFAKYNFTAWKDIYNLLEAQSGKKVVSKTHILLKNRNFLVLSVIQNDVFKPIILKEFHSNDNFPLKLSFKEELLPENPNKNIIFVDENKLKFPLTLRRWQDGDVFYPLGMKGSKKLSKYFKDEKLSVLEKQDVLILESDQKIVWIVNHRADARFVNTDKNKNNIKIELP